MQEKKRIDLSLLKVLVTDAFEKANTTLCDKKDTKF